jgi:hypothetical protein
VKLLIEIAALFDKPVIEDVDFATNELSQPPRP